MFVLSVHRRQIKMVILVLCIAVVAVAFFFVSKQGVEAAKRAPQTAAPLMDDAILIGNSTLPQ